MNRRLEQHRKNHKALQSSDGEDRGGCYKCANIWCAFNVTPDADLPTKEDRMGKTIQDTCPDFTRDEKIPDVI